MNERIYGLATALMVFNALILLYFYFYESFNRVFVLIVKRSLLFFLFLLSTNLWFLSFFLLPSDEAYTEPIEDDSTASGAKTPAKAANKKSAKTPSSSAKKGGGGAGGASAAEKAATAQLLELLELADALISPALELDIEAAAAAAAAAASGNGGASADNDDNDNGNGNGYTGSSEIGAGMSTGGEHTGPAVEALVEAAAAQPSLKPLLTDWQLFVGRLLDDSG
jgi:hypothetical protein